jgi:hypothetical protein
VSDFTTLAKREGLTQAWSLWIKSATGEAPIIQRHATGVNILWKPGQAKKMRDYLDKAMSPSTTEKGPDGKPKEGVNVKVDFKTVLLPLAIKKSWLYVVGGVAGVALLTKLGT